MATYSYIAAGSANQDSQVVAGPPGAGVQGGISGWIDAVDVYNGAAAARFVKIYDKATAPTSADTPLLRIGIPAGSARAIPLRRDDARYGQGLGIRITVGVADNDVAAATANDVVLNIVYR